MQLIDLYQELIIDHGTTPRNFGILEPHSHHAHGVNQLCGDKVYLYLMLDDANIITDIKFNGLGCAISTASASILTELVKNQSSTFALQLQHVLHETLTNTNNSINNPNNNSLHNISNNSLNSNTINSCHNTNNNSLNNNDTFLKSLDKNNKNRLMALSGISQYPNRLKCGLLAWHALREALQKNSR